MAICSSIDQDKCDRLKTAGYGTLLYIVFFVLVLICSTIMDDLINSHDEIEID